MAKTLSQTKPQRSKQVASKTPSPLSNAFADDDLGKIQAILFGEQSHKFEAQLEEINNKFDRLIAQTTSEFTAQLNALETSHQRRIDDLKKDLEKKTAALNEAKLDSKSAGRIMAEAAEKLAKS